MKKYKSKALEKVVKKKSYFKINSGITLIALIITVIVLLILAGVAISMIAGQDGLFGKATSAADKYTIETEKEAIRQAFLYAALEKYDGIGEGVTEQRLMDLLSGTGGNVAVTKEGTNYIITFEKSGNTYKTDESGIVLEVNGEVATNNNGGNGNNETPEIIHGATSNYVQVNGVYYNSPDLSGFNAECTYYVIYNDTGTEITDQNTLITQTAPAGWYDYKNKKWANVVTKQNGNITYWTWIPRFKYKVKDGKQETDVRFVTTDNKYYADVDEVKTEIELDNTYQLPVSFTFDNKPLAGYWVSKYRIQEGTHIGTGDTSLSNITIDLSKFNAECTYYVIYDNAGTTITSDKTPISATAPEGWYDYGNKRWANIVTKQNGSVTYWTYIPRYEYKVFEALQRTYIRFIPQNKTTPDEGFVIPASFTFDGKPLAGYWTSKYRVEKGTTDGTDDTSLSNITVDLSGFEEKCTYYVVYNEDGTAIESENVPISLPAPNGWYDYGRKRWANVMTENNGSKTYWTYIPRYEYKVFNGVQNTYIRFIPKTKTTPDDGFEIPVSFTFDGKQLDGYWVSKYRLNG